MPTQNTPAASADGSLRQKILPASRVHSVSHQNAVAQATAAIAGRMPWLMKSTASSRFHRCSADDPVYFCLPRSAARRTG